MTWDEPQKPYGMIVNYQVRLLDSPARSSDEVAISSEIATTNEEVVGRISEGPL